MVSGGASERSKGLRIRGVAGGSSQLPWGPYQRAASLVPVKGLAGLVADRVCSKDARNHFDPPSLRLDTVALSAGRQLGDGGAGEPVSSTARPTMAASNARLKAGSTDVGAASAVWRPKQR